MIATIVLDVLLLGALAALLVFGLRRGLARSVGSILGLAVSGLAAYFLMPIITALLPWPAWRMLLTIVVSVLVLVAGHALGSALGTLAGGGDRARPSGLSRLLGTAASGLVGALAISLVTGGVAQLGAPVVSQAAQQSAIASAIEQVTPDPIDAFIAGLRGSILSAGGMGIEEPIIEDAEEGGDPGGGEAPAPTPPTTPHNAEPRPEEPQRPGVSDPIAEAARSVVRIAGTAYSCGRDLTGSGVVIAPDRIITNAHVVAGVEQPLVETPDGQSVEGRVVYFDPRADLAVIATSGLRAASVDLDDNLVTEGYGTVGGYPYGGPYAVEEVHVVTRGGARMPDIYREAIVERHIYVLSGEVRPGQSGGPVFDDDGDLVGLLFGRAADGTATAYAVTGQEVGPVVAQSGSLTTAVATGGCPALAF